MATVYFLNFKELTYVPWCNTRWWCVDSLPDIPADRLLEILNTLNHQAVKILLRRGCVWGTKTEVRRWLAQQYYRVIKQHNIVDILRLSYSDTLGPSIRTSALEDKTAVEWDSALRHWSRHVVSQIDFYEYDYFQGR